MEFNLRASHTVAPTTVLEATETFTYYPDGRPFEHTDFRGNILAKIYHTCCGRLQATIDRDGQTTTIHNSDFEGQPTHTATVSAVPVPVPQQPGGIPTLNYHDPINADTVQETTTRFDGRGRPTHTTRWLVPLGNVVDHARANLGNGVIPIAGLDGIPATDGLTTTYTYDDNLTDGTGLDAQFAAQLTEMNTRGITLGAGSDGYATRLTNPAGESTLTAQDGAGRTILQVSPDGAVTTIRHDALATPVSPHPETPIPGTLLATTATDPNGNSQTSYSDGAGRTLAQKDPQNFLSLAGHDPNGNRLATGMNRGHR